MSMEATPRKEFYVYSSQLLSIVIISLVVISATSVVGIILLSALGKQSPEILNYVILSSISCLAGILVPAKRKDE